MTDFGQILDGTQVESAVKATLQRWMDTYLREVEHQNGLDPNVLPSVRSWIATNDFDTFPEDQLPCVLVISTGLLEQPRKGGAGVYRGKWGVGAAVIVAADTHDHANQLAKWYLAAVEAILVQKRSLGDFADDTEWLGDAYNDMPAADSRAQFAGRAMFAVSVDNVLSRYAGPSEPDGIGVDNTAIDPTVLTVSNQESIAP